LAKPFEAEDLARGIQWVVADAQRLKSLRANSRRNAEERFSASVVAEQYRAVYEQAIAG
jgi:glycosyltransferase involved in cell wall biosynthesis